MQSKVITHIKFATKDETKELLQQNIMDQILHRFRVGFALFTRRFKEKL
jgi:hypothetical protein